MIEKQLLQAVEPLIEDIVALEKRVESITLTPGPEGKPGKDGASGADADPLAVAEIIVSKHADLIRGQKGDPGQPGADGKDGVDGAPGRDGLDADPDIVAKRLAEAHADALRGLPGKDGADGAPGKDAAPEDVASVMLDKYADYLRGQKGDPGADGKDGKDGKDGVDADPEIVANVIVEKHADRLRGERGADGLGIQTKAWEPGIYREGTFITAEIGRTYKALRDTSGEPGKSDDWERVGTGGFAFKGLKKDGAVYQDGDLYIDGGSCFLWWNGKGRMVVQRGQKGEAGAPGESGKDGKDAPTVVAIKASVDGLAFAFDDGNIIDADIEGLMALVNSVATEKALLAIEQIDIQQTQLGTPIKVFRGTYLPDKDYTPGDVVRSGNGTWLCIKAVRGSLNGDYWVKLAGMGVGGSGGGATTGLPPQLSLTLGVLAARTNGAPMWINGWGMVSFVVDANARRALNGVSVGAIVYQADTGQYWTKTGTGWSLFGGGGMTIYRNVADPRAATAANGDFALIRDDTLGYTGANRIQFRDNSLWVPIGYHHEVKTRAQANPAGAVKGDLAFSTDKNHVLVEIWDGSAWQVIHDDDDIARRIAASRSFRGTVVEPGNSQIGSNQLSQLTPETALNLADVGNYWTYTGRDGYVIPANSLGGVALAFSIVTDVTSPPNDMFEIDITAAGTAARSITVDFDIDSVPAHVVTLINRGDTADDIAQHIADEINALALVADASAAGSVVQVVTRSGEILSNLSVTVQGQPGPSRIDGAGLTPGDWIQVFNAGGDGQGTNPPPDLHYTIIHGDILSASRAQGLFGLAAWNAGSTYEQGSLVNYAGDIWKAVSNVVANQPAPSATSTFWAKVPIYGNTKFVADNAALALIAAPTAGDGCIVLADTLNSGQPSLYVYVNGRWTAVGSSIKTLSDTQITNLADGDQLQYDAAKAKWVNKQIGGGGLSIWRNGVTYGSGDLVWHDDKFWQSVTAANTLEPGKLPGPPKGMIYTKFAFLGYNGKTFVVNTSWDNHIPTFVHAFPPLDGTTNTMWQFRYDPTGMGDEYVDRNTDFGYWLEQHYFSMDVIGIVYNPNDGKPYFLNHGRDNIYVSFMGPGMNYEGTMERQIIRQLTPPTDSQLTVNVSNINGLGAENSRVVFWIYDDPAGTAAPPENYKSNGYDLPAAGGGGPAPWQVLNLSKQPEHAQTINQARYMTQAEYNALTDAQRVGMIVIVG